MKEDYIDVGAVTDTSSVTDASQAVDYGATAASAVIRDYKPWIGDDGLVLEVVEHEVTVRVFQAYKELGLSADAINDIRGGSGELPQITAAADLSKKMRQVAKNVADLNRRIPMSCLDLRVKMVAITNASPTSFKQFNNKGLIVLGRSVLKEKSKLGSRDTLAHECAHAIFDCQLRFDAKSGFKDSFTLYLTRIYILLRATQEVFQPTQPFSEENKPPVVAYRNGQPAGITMVNDILWTKEIPPQPGHPESGADELFASAYAGYIQRSELLEKIIWHYVENYPKAAGRSETEKNELQPLAKALWKVLENWGRPDRYKDLAPISEFYGDTVEQQQELRWDRGLAEVTLEEYRGAPVNYIQSTPDFSNLPTELKVLLVPEKELSKESE